MRQILIADVNRRLNGLSKINSASSQSRLFSEGARSIINTKRVVDIKRFIESAGKGNSEVPFSLIMELFDALTENGTVSDISKMGHYIAENVTHKVRDAKQSESVIRRRLTRLQNKLKAPSTSTPKIQINKDKAIKEAYENMLEKVIIYRNCDRVLENYNTISKRFNLEAVINENTRMNGVYDTVVELCNRIDTYEMPNITKFNTVIETALYGFESNSIEYKKSDILEAAIDYFAFKENGLEACRSILESTLFYDKNEDMGNIDILTEEEPEDEDSGDSSVDSVIRSHYVNTSKDTTVTESTEFSEIFNKFKKEELTKDGKPESKLRQLVSKLYSRNVDSIVEDTPNLFTWIRSFFIVGSCAVPVIGPVLMIVGFIADRFISLHMTAKETKKMITCFDNEIKASKNKLESASTADDKERLQKYIESLEKAREKVHEYYTGICDDDDIEFTYDSIGGSDLFGDDDFDFDFEDDLDFNISEMVNSVENIIKCNNTNYISENLIFDLPSRLNNESLVEMGRIVAHLPDVFFKESFVEGLYNELKSVRKTESGIARSIRINTIESVLHDLENSKITANDKPITVYEANTRISAIAETCGAINMLYSIPANYSDESILEASFMNTIRLASMKLKNAFTKLGDKERNVSKTVDLTMNNFAKSAEKALTTDNREAVIKGSILPSASKLIKLCLANAGLVALHHPLAAVILTLGYIGCSAKFKAKERQMLIDEIEIEINMCDKYISIAEQKNDMKALKQLMMTKRDLERQLQRIKYKMRVELGKKYYDPKHVGDQ